MSSYLYEEEDMIAALKDVRKMWKRKVTASDARIIEEMFLEYGFNPSCVRWLLEFIHKRGAVSLNYIYSIADVLKRENVTDEIHAELLLEKKFDRYKPVFKNLNIYRSIPTSREKEMIDGWYEQYHFTEDRIRKVCAYTAGQAKTPSVAYADAVLMATVS